MFVKLHEVLEKIPAREMNTNQLCALTRQMVTVLINRAMESGDEEAKQHLINILHELDFVEDYGNQYLLQYPTDFPKSLEQEKWDNYYRDNPVM